jgi:hypothetical protein
MPSVNSFAIGFYVVDEVGRAGILAGPFTNPQLAQDEQHALNIADDCGIWHRDTNGQFTPYRGYSLNA